MNSTDLHTRVMPKDRFLRLIEEILGLEPHALQGSEWLRETRQWDSMAVVDFLALADKHTGAAPSIDDIGNCATFDDLYALVER